MNKILTILLLFTFTSCSVNIVQNTGREAAILEDNDSYDADMDLDADIAAEIPLSLI